MEIAVLGPLVVGNGTRGLGATKERAVVEFLALRAPDPVSVDALVAAVWGEWPPPSATKTLQSLVSRARRALPELAVERVGDAYRLIVDRVDAFEFERLVIDGRRALQDGDADDAVELLTAARRMWRGMPAPDVADGPARSACTRLEELFRTMVEDLHGARLEIGGDAALIADLDEATAVEPLREQRWAQLMLALHRDGRQVEALRAFRRARTILGEQLGLEPSEDLRDLERAIIAEDPTLSATRRSWSGPRRARRPGRRARPRLPPILTSFVGRGDERRLVAKRLDDGSIVTIAGPGGVGKTRLAIELAGDLQDSFADGVWFVDLTPTTETLSLTSAVAEAIGVHETPGTALDVAILDRCTSLRGVIVLDNCEHVIGDVASLVHGLLAAARNLRVLATSREALGVAGEVVVPLAPLATPPSSERATMRIAAIDAVRLFADRAVAVDPAFEINEHNAVAVASLCRRLDGLPLAIELAAAQAYVLGPAQIDARLGDRFGVLHSHQRTGLDRHRNLRALLDWSVARLDPVERTIFHRLSVFPSTMSLDAIEAVVTDDDVALSDVLPALIHLVRSSLVVAEGTGAVRRYRLLETVRQYARDRLTDDDDLGRRRDRHRDWFLRWAVEAAKDLHGDAQGSALDALDEEFDNVEAALEWSAADPERAALSLGPVQELFDFWLARGTRRAQGVHWNLAITEAAATVAPAIRVRAMAQANVIIGQSDLEAAARIAEAARRLASTVPDDERAALYAAIATCWTDVATGVPPSYAPLAAEQAQAPHDPDRIWIDAILSSCLATTGDLAGGRKYMRRILDDPRLDRDRHARGSFLAFAVDIDAAIGDDLEPLRDEARESLQIATDLHCPSCAAQALVSLALVDTCDDLGGPVAVARRSLQLADSIDETMGVLRALDMLVGALAADGQAAMAVRVAAATQTLRRRTGYAEHEPGRRAYRQSGLDLARNLLTADAFTSEWSAGHRLDYAHLIDELLSPVM